jgi:hypothetical protein
MTVVAGRCPDLAQVAVGITLLSGQGIGARVEIQYINLPRGSRVAFRTSAHGAPPGKRANAQIQFRSGFRRPRQD